MTNLNAQTRKQWVTGTIHFAKTKPCECLQTKHLTQTMSHDPVTKFLLLIVTGTFIKEVRTLFLSSAHENSMFSGVLHFLHIYNYHMV